MNNLWEKLMNGFDGIRVINEFGDLPCGYIDDLYFDHNKFKISKKEVESMDPQQILTLILSDLLFQDSSVKKEDLWGSKTGVYIGSWNLDYEGNKSSAYYAIGKNPSIISARINSHYNLLLLTLLESRDMLQLSNNLYQVEVVSLFARLKGH